MLKRMRTMGMKDFVMVLACVISVAKNMLDSSEIFGSLNSVTDLLLGVFFLCIVYKLMTQTYTMGSLLMIGALVLLGVYSTFTIKYYSLLYSIMFIIAMQGCRIEQILKSSVVTKISILTIHVSAYIMAYVFSPSSIHFIYRNGVKRNTFFLNHPNTFTAYLTWTCMEILFLLYQRIRFWHILLIWSLNLLFYQFTNSNSGIIIITFTSACLVLDKLGKQKQQGLIHYIARYGFGFFSLLFLGIAKIYPYLSGSLKAVWDKMDDLLTGRLLYGAYALDNFGITWFGKIFNFPQKSYWNGHWQDKIIFDNLYYQTYFFMGAVFLVIISIALYLIGNRTTYQQKLFISSCVVYGVMENYIVNVFIVFPLMITGLILMKKPMKKET